MFVMKVESSSNLKTWRISQNEKEASQDLYLACISFVVLLGFAVADAALRM
jgi:hypothetical protein